MPRVPDLVCFCRRHELKMIAIAELVRYRLKKKIPKDYLDEER